MCIKILGRNIYNFRLLKGLSQEELSDKSGVERAQISKIENGDIYGVTYLTIERILNALDKKNDFIEFNRVTKINLRPFVKWAGEKLNF